MTRLSQIQAKIIYISLLTFTSLLFSTDNTQDTETEDRKPKITHVDENTQQNQNEKGSVQSKVGCDDILEAAKAVLSNIDKGASNIDNDKNFKILLTNLRKLKTKGSIAPWCSAINQYMEYSKVDVDLNELQKNILKQSETLLVNVKNNLTELLKQ